MRGMMRFDAQPTGVRAFDVICAGDAVLTLGERAGDVASRARLTLRSGGGAVNTAVGLAARGLRVGLVTALPDDTAGRELRAKVAARGVDVGGVDLVSPRQGLARVRGAAAEVDAFGEEEHPIAVPASWQSQVLLLCGVSPVVSHAAALCRAARAARRAGTIVVLDLDARWSLWEGQDPRRIRMVLREADVVWCDAHDLFRLNLDYPTLRASLRDDAVLVSSDGMGRARATGPFGGVARRATRGDAAAGGNEGFPVAICEELARAGHADERDGALWARALDRAP